MGQHLLDGDFLMRSKTNGDFMCALRPGEDERGTETKRREKFNEKLQRNRLRRVWRSSVLDAGARAKNDLIN